MESQGHWYSKGRCPRCGAPSWAIDGDPQCDCDSETRINWEEDPDDEEEEEESDDEETD